MKFFWGDNAMSKIVNEAKRKNGSVMMESGKRYDN